MPHDSALQADLGTRRSMVKAMSLDSTFAKLIARNAGIDTVLPQMMQAVSKQTSLSVGNSIAKTITADSAFAKLVAGNAIDSPTLMRAVSKQTDFGVGNSIAKTMTPNSEFANLMARNLGIDTVLSQMRAASKQTSLGVANSIAKTMTLDSALAKLRAVPHPRQGQGIPEASYDLATEADGAAADMASVLGESRRLGIKPAIHDPTVRRVVVGFACAVVALNAFEYSLTNPELAAQAFTIVAIIQLALLTAAWLERWLGP